MICSKCGAKVADSGGFCPVCGAPSVAETPAQPAANYVPKHAAPEPSYRSTYQTPVWDSVQQNAPAQNPVKTCPHCGKPVEDGIAFCGSCGYRLTAPAAPVPPVSPAAPAQPRRKTGYSAVAKNTRVWVPIVSGVALLLVVALVIGIISVSGGPLVKIGSAVQKTVKAGNFTAEYEVEIGNQSLDGTIFTDIDTKARTVSMYTVIESGYVEITYGIYDGYMFMLADYGGYSYGYTEDIEDVLDEIFDAYEDTGSSDMTELLEQINDLMDEYLGEELSDYFDLEELEKCVKTYAKAASKEKWLKTNLGYTKTSKSGETLHTFAPNLYDFMMASLPYFEDSFEDSDMYDELMDFVDDSEDYLDDAEMEFAIGVKSGYLSSVTMVMDVDGGDVEISVEIYDVNKTKLDADELAEMLEEAERNS